MQKASERRATHIIESSNETLTANVKFDFRHYLTRNKNSIPDTIDLDQDYLDTEIGFLPDFKYYTGLISR